LAHLIVGTVQDLHGAPVPEARVYFVGGPGPFPDIAALTNERGEFALTAPTAGRYRIECAAEGFDLEVVEVDAEESGESSIAVSLRRSPN
jgi:Carboxypeptidase regulatory-like domain